jgi:hypothetical protein
MKLLRRCEPVFGEAVSTPDWIGLLQSLRSYS